MLCIPSLRTLVASAYLSVIVPQTSLAAQFLTTCIHHVYRIPVYYQLSHFFDPYLKQAKSMEYCGGF